MAFRIISSGLLKATCNNICYNPEVKKANAAFLFQVAYRNIFQQTLSKNLELTSNDNLIVKDRPGKLPLVELEKNRPLVILLKWMLAQRKHVDKYLELYLKKGFDILTVSTSMRQLLWPTKGTQIIAEETLSFLNENKGFQPLLVHGFSVGGYLWGEILVLMNNDLEKYKPLIDRIKGQVWDSTPDITEFAKGFPHAIFPKNAVLRAAVGKSIDYHLKTFQESATQHYVRASQLFHTTPVRAPALVFIAKNDPIANLNTVARCKEAWDSMGMRTYMKCWDKSRHVSHFHLHRKEYLETLETFLSSLDQINSQDIVPSVTLKAKATAKA